MKEERKEGRKEKQVLVRMWRNGILVCCLCECKMSQLPKKAIWQFLEEFNIQLSCDPAILFLSIYPKELKTGNTNTHVS
jgi:Cys-tRNA synthase (O-phospho-L-seryl-tRNA:Cys-tRNA synthase)